MIPAGGVALPKQNSFNFKNTVINRGIGAKELVVEKLDSDLLVFEYPDEENTLS